MQSKNQMRLHYDPKIRRSLQKSNALNCKEKLSQKDSVRRSNSRKGGDSIKRLTDHEIRFLHLKNENRNSFGHLYQNYFGLRPSHGRKTSLNNKNVESKGSKGQVLQKTLDQKRRSLADLKSHFKINKNEFSGGIGSSLGKNMGTRSKFDSLNSK